MIAIHRKIITVSFITCGLLQICRSEEPSLQTYIDKLSSTNLAERKASIKKLGEAGTKGIIASDRLCHILGEGGEVEFAAKDALKAIGRDAIPILRKNLLEAIDRIIREHCPIEGFFVMFDLTDILASFGKDAIPLFEEMLTHKFPFVRAHFAGKLGGMGKDAIGSIPELAKLLDDHEPAFVQIDAAMAIWKINGDVEIAIRTLIGGLDVADERDKLYAIQNLFYIGPKAKTALNRLRELKNENSADVRLQAERAVDYIESLPNIPDSGRRIQ